MLGPEITRIFFLIVHFLNRRGRSWLQINQKVLFLVKLAEKIQGGDQFNIGAAASKLILIAAQVAYIQGA